MFTVMNEPKELVINQATNIALHILNQENGICTDFHLMLKAPLQLSILTEKRLSIGRIDPQQYYEAIVRLKGKQEGEYFLTCSNWSYRNSLGKTIKPESFELKFNVISLPYDATTPHTPPATQTEQYITQPLTAIRNALGSLYPDNLSIRRIGSDAGINLSLINFNSNAQNVWYDLLIEANKNNQVGALLHVVKSEYGANEKFQDAYSAYLSSDIK
ncbi:MAG: effector-associated domain EAD1-containing protein [Chloroflexota bacterium]